MENNTCELCILKYLVANLIIDDKLAVQVGKLLEGAQAPSQN